MANPSHQADPENNSKCVMKTDWVCVNHVQKI